MAVGDEVGLSEELYQSLIGRYVAAIEVLTKRLVLKDQHISRIETENAQLGAKLAQAANDTPDEPKEGDIKYEVPE